LSKDVKWAEWVKLKPTHGMSIFEKQPELLKEECCVEKAEEYEIIDMDEEHYERQVIQPVQNPVTSFRRDHNHWPATLVWFLSR